MKKNNAFLIALLLGLATTFAHAQSDTVLVDKIIATVGDKVVLFSELEEQYRSLEYKEADARCLLLDQMLTQTLLLVQAEIDSILVSEEDVETQLNARVERILQMMNYDRNQFIAYYNKTPEEIKEEFREDLTKQLTAQKMQGTIMEGLKITPAEVKEFFNRIPVDSLPYFSSEVEIGEIVLEPKPNKEELKKSFDLLSDVRKRIVEGGEDFAALAKKYSEDPGSGRRGGDLGWGKRGQYVTEFEAAAYKLTENEISPVIRTEYGYHIIQLLGRRGNLVNLRHILIKPRITEADMRQTRMELDTIRQLILSDSISFTQAATKYSMENVQSKSNAGLMVNPKTGNSLFEVADLDPDVYFVIDTMSIGSISVPFRFQDPQTGQQLYRIIELRSQTEPHQANLKDDYAKIQMAALEQKKAKFLNQWVQSKVSQNYVKIDERYFGCEALQKWLIGSKKLNPRP